jgi:transcription-repair coupling factor (superfamily II helicase)
MPDSARALVETHRLRVAAEPAGIVKIDAHTESAVLQFKPNPPVDALRIIDLVQKNRHIKLNGQDKLRITAKMPDLASRVSQLRATIKSLVA